MQASNREQSSPALLRSEVDSRTASLSAAVVKPKPLDACVICLDPISERAVAVPCNHCAFDFICVVTWLQGNSTCPLCKARLSAIQYDWRSPDDFKTYHVPSASDQIAPAIPNTPRRTPGRTRRLNRYPPYRPSSPALDVVISRRRYVYRYHLYSLHVGSNRLSCFRDFTPQIFNHNVDLQSRARKWIRRELQVFDFLSSNPGTNEQVLQSTSDQNSGGTLQARRADNAEFLLEYIMAILRTVDIKSSSGRAQEMLKEFLGEENAHLFLHELSAWLRSPYTSLEDWDRHVQYRVKLPDIYSQPEQQARDTCRANPLEQPEASIDRFRRQGIEARRRYEAD